MQTGAEHLIDINKRLHGLVLPDDLLPQCTLKLASCSTAFFRVQKPGEPLIHHFSQVRTAFFFMGRLCCCHHNCSFYCTSSTQRDPFVAHLSEFWSDSLSSRSLLIHSRMYRPQFFSLIESASDFSRNLTASPSPDLTSAQSTTIRLPSVSA